MRLRRSRRAGKDHRGRQLQNHSQMAKIEAHEVLTESFQLIVCNSSRFVASAFKHSLRHFEILGRRALTTDRRALVKYVCALCESFRLF